MSTQVEEWRNIKGFSDYKVSNKGNIKTFNGVLLKQSTNKYGYNYVSLSADGKHRIKSVHRLVAGEFIANKDNKPQVNHIDGNKSNNNVTNLEWVTGYENYTHAVRAGLIKNDSILDDKKVLEVYELAQKETMTHKEIGNLYNISTATVSGIKNKKTRASVLNPSIEKPHIELDEEAVLDIYSKGRKGWSNSQIQEIYPISCQTITNIKYGRRWAWLTEPEGFIRNSKKTIVNKEE
jgi:hypothetical protein